MNVKGSPNRVTMHFPRKSIFVTLFMLLSLISNGDSKCIYNGRRSSTIECTGHFNSTELTSPSSEVTTVDVHDAITLPLIHLQPMHFFKNSNFKYVNYIRIHNTTLIAVEKNAFGGLLYLRDLDISDNHILETIHPEAISQANDLRTLGLSGNTKLFNQIIGPILISEVLEELDLSRCEIEHLPYNAFDQLTGLIFLRLDHNKIRKLPATVFRGLHYIQEINLSKNFLRSLPQGMLLNSTDILTLTLYGNPISDIPEDIFSDSLETLDLRETEITTLNIPSPSDLTNLNLEGSPFSSLKNLSNFPNLRYLSLSNTNIPKLDQDSFENNTRLETIHLSGIPSLSLPPKFLGYFDYLYFMDISNSGLDHLMPNLFENMSSIATLNLSRNSLSDSESLGRALNPLTDLKILDLSHNKLRVIGEEDFSGNQFLKKLFLSGNQLVSAPSLSRINQLTFLDLSHCTLTSIHLPDIFQRANVLEQLFLSHNNLSSIIDEEDHEGISPEDIPGSLQLLDLRENPWSCDPPFLSLIEEAKKRDIQPSSEPPQQYTPSWDHDKIIAQAWNHLIHEVCEKPQYDVAITLRPLNLPPAVLGTKAEEFPTWIWYIVGLFLTFSIAFAVALDWVRRHNRQVHQANTLLPSQKSINISLVGAAGGMKVSGRSKDYQRLQEDRSPSSPTTPRIYKPPKGDHFTFPDVQSARDPESLAEFSDGEKE